MQFVVHLQHCCINKRLEEWKCNFSTNYKLKIFEISVSYWHTHYTHIHHDMYTAYIIYLGNGLRLNNDQSVHIFKSFTCEKPIFFALFCSACFHSKAFSCEHTHHTPRLNACAHTHILYMAGTLYNTSYL